MNVLNRTKVPRPSFRKGAFQTVRFKPCRSRKRWNKWPWTNPQSSSKSPRSPTLWITNRFVSRFRTLRRNISYLTSKLLRTTLFFRNFLYIFLLFVLSAYISFSCKYSITFHLLSNIFFLQCVLVQPRTIRKSGNFQSVGIQRKLFPPHQAKISCIKITIIYASQGLFMIRNFNSSIYNTLLTNSK